MKFAGFIKNSFVDYPNEIAAVVFTSGCNFSCWYCHNNQLIKENKQLEKIDESEVLEFLSSRRGLLDGLVISGGEPTLHADLISFAEKVKKLGFKIKLDTNGTSPDVLRTLINKKLIDFVAMDIKTSLDNYEKIVGKIPETFIPNVSKSIDILMTSGIDYEFRTTFAPDISITDISAIAQRIAGAKSYAIQKYNPVNDKVLRLPHSYESFQIAVKTAQKYVENSFLRSLD